LDLIIQALNATAAKLEVAEQLSEAEMLEI
jgi:hypothetical protein